MRAMWRIKYRKKYCSSCNINNGGRLSVLDRVTRTYMYSNDEYYRNDCREDGRRWRHCCRLTLKRTRDVMATTVCYLWSLLTSSAGPSRRHCITHLSIHLRVVYDCCCCCCWTWCHKHLLLSAVSPQQTLIRCIWPR